MNYSFDETAGVLSGAGVNVSPAELQGFLCGYLCTGSRDHDSWLQQAGKFLDVAEAATELKTLLVSLFDEHDACISQVDFEFQLLLPDEDDELSVRVLLVGQWCQGFLTGFGTGCTDERVRTLSDDVKTTLADFVAIAQISDEELDDGAAENNYTEITEYLRMAMLSVAMECRQPVENTSPNTAVH